MMKTLLAACFCVAWAVTCYAQGLRPDQISPGTPDITFGPGGSGYQIGSTVPWRSDSSTGPTFLALDAAKTVELTAVSPITATLPDTGAAGLGDGFGFAIQTTAQLLTLNGLNKPPQQKINGLNQVKVGPYQFVSLSSRGGNWYATFSLPQPATQTGTTMLNDQMLWVAGVGSASTITGVTLSGNTFLGGTSATVGAVGVTMSPTTPAFSGTLSLTGAAASSFLLSSTTLPSNLTTNGVVANGTYNLNIVATQAGATGSPFTQPETITGSSGGSAPTGSCAQSTAFFARVWALPATLDGTIGTAASSTNHVRAYDDLICGMVADTDAGSTVFSTLDGLYIFATAAATGSSTAVANLNLAAATGCTTACYHLTPSSTPPTHTANTGYTVPAGSAIYLDTGFNPVTAAGGKFTGSSASMMLWSFTDLDGSNVGIGAADAAANNNQLILKFSGEFYGWIGQPGSNATHAAVPASTGSFIFLTIGSSQFMLRNGTALSISAGGGNFAPSTMPNLNIYVLNRNETTVNNGTGRMTPAAAFGSGWHGSMATAVHTRVCTFLTAVHGSC